MITLTKKQLINLANEAMGMDDLSDIPISESGTKYHAYLYLIAKKMEPERIVELGTYTGESSKYMAIAAPKSQVWTCDVNKDAKRWIDEVEPILSNIKAYTIDALCFNKIYDGKPIDILFIDANHDYSLTMAEYNLWEPLVRKGGLIIFDDIYLDSEMDTVRSDLGLTLIDIPGVHTTGFGIIIK